MFNFFKKKALKPVDESPVKVDKSPVKFSISSKIQQFQFSQDGQHLYLLTVDGKLYDGQVYKRGEKSSEFAFNEVDVKIPGKA